MSKMKLNYYKPKKIDMEYLAKQYEASKNSEMNENNSFNPYLIENVQLYNPIYREFFDMNAKNFDSIALNHPYHVQDTRHVLHSPTNQVQEKPVFIKFSPLLDPYRYMIGKYNVTDSRIRSMPRLESTEETVHAKILSIYNASYVDCFFSYLSSVLLNHHGIVHGMDYYGSYLGLQKKFRVCVTDDVEYLRNSDFFNKHVGELFSIEDPDLVMERKFPDSGSRRHHAKLVLDNVDEITLDFEELSDHGDKGEILDSSIKPDTPLLSDDSLHLDTLETVYAKSPKSSGSITSKTS